MPGEWQGPGGEKVVDLRGWITHLLWGVSECDRKHGAQTFREPGGPGDGREP